MRSRLPLGIAAMLLTIMAVGVQVAEALEPGRLTALAERHELRDVICIAMADGRIGPLERSIIVFDAKRVLSPQEYSGFMRALNRVSPPKPSSTKQMAYKKSSKVAQKGGKAASKKTKVAQTKASYAVRQAAATLQDASPILTIPATVILPDHVASPGQAW